MKLISGARVLVTGGAGFIGSHLARTLAASCNVVVLDNLSVGRRENLEPYLGEGRIQLIEGDICDRAAVAEAMDQCEIVFHCAVQCLRVSLSNPRLVHEVNVTGTLNLCEAALEKRVKRFVYVSSSEVYGTARSVPMDEDHPLDPTTPYGASKLAGELYTRTFYLTYGLPTIVVRPFNTYGPLAHFEGAYGEVIPKFVLRSLNNKPPIIFGDGRQTRDFTYVTDTVRGLLMAAECDDLLGEEINIAYGQEVSIREVAICVLEIVGKPDLQPVYTGPRPGDVHRHFACIRKARRRLGFQPQVELRTGLRDYVEWFVQSVDPARALPLETERNWSEALMSRRLTS